MLKVVMGPEKKSRRVREKAKRMTAFHEAGHAVIAEVLEPESVNFVSVRSHGGDAGGFTNYYQPEEYWLFLGGEQAFGVFKDENPESPFYVNSSIGEIREVLHGDEYENIVSDDLALERAKFEIYNHCRLNDTINLTTIPIYWADVNWKVSYAPLGKNISYQYVHNVRTLCLKTQRE